MSEKPLSPARWGGTRMTNLEKAVKDLQDNLLVLAEIERRQSEMLREHSELLVVNERNIAKLNAESAVFQHRTDQNLAEIQTSSTASSVIWTAYTAPPRNRP